MLTEKDLLLDIMHNTPEFSVWNISSDSWEKIPEVFSQYILVNDVYGWDIIINQGNRKDLIKIIDKEEIYDKVVHQNISLNGDIIFKSYDNMMMNILGDSFPIKDELLIKYSIADVCLE